MSLRYKEFSGLNLPAIEKEILAKWQDGKAFEQSMELRDGATPFVFYEGPPSANGLPGIHHVISRTLKDLVCRYKTMKGFQVKRKGGWDTHGLPIELGVEKELGITKEDIGKKISVEEYNQKCREAVLRYKKEWDDITTQMGYWVDLENPYITFENKYIETLWWILKTLYNKDLLYESVSIQPYSPAAGTGLSSHELNQPGTYKDVKDTSATVMFTLLSDQTPNRNSQEYENTVKNTGNPICREINKIIKDEYQVDREVYFLAWTTTPWTLPSNLGLTVGGNIDYALVKTFSPINHQPINVILAKALLHKYFKAEGENGDFENYTPESKLIPYKILTEFKGDKLKGLRYQQLMKFDEMAVQLAGGDNFKVVVGDFVTTEDGTGIVHTAPAFGADDLKVGRQSDLGVLIMVDTRGKFLSSIRDDVFLYGEEYVKEDYLTDAEKVVEFQKQKQILEANGKVKDLKKYLTVDERIVLKLQEEGKLFKKEKYEHSYPHCWRTDKPILYYPLDAWFIKTTALKDKMVELNKTINWKPASTGTGRFGNWLENMVDWNLSRSRFWGTPLPIWKSVDADGNFIDEKEGGEMVCIGTIEELNTAIRNANDVLGGDVNKHYLHEGILDLHKPYVDDIILVSPTSKPMKRVPDLIDVWFDSGAMPYAQWGLDYEKVKAGDLRPFNAPFDTNYPADFIAEGVDQTRGWFYTLHAISSLLYEEVAYKTVVSNGLVLDKNGVKMSKRLGNIVNPFETIEKYGADATRWYLITNASPWDNLKFDLAGIQEVQRKFFGTVYNTYQFFALYSNVDGFAFKEAYIPLEERPEIDRWILSSLNTLIKTVTASMDDYEPTAAGRAVEVFVDEHLSNWYVRLCRRRFWKGEYEQDKICAYQTLYECLETIVRLMAPISPFFSDAVFRNLNAVTERYAEESVHHVLFPVANEAVVDKGLEERMQLAQDTCSLLLSIRKKVNIKVRQPLQKVLIPVMNSTMQAQLEKIEDLIKAEVNVKEIEYLTDTEGFIKKKIKPNFIALGKKLGPKMKAVTQAMADLQQHDIAAIEKDGQIEILIDGEPLILLLSETEIAAEDIPGWSVASKGSLTVALDITISPELKQEGDARELVNRIQGIRKDKGFNLTDRILVCLEENEILRNSVNAYKTYICGEILADSLDWVLSVNDGTEIEINDTKIIISVFKKGE